jgi:hypothetical protein
MGFEDEVLAPFHKPWSLLNFRLVPFKLPKINWPSASKACTSARNCSLSRLPGFVAHSSISALRLVPKSPSRNVSSTAVWKELLNKSTSSVSMFEKIPCSSHAAQNALGSSIASSSAKSASGDPPDPVPLCATAGGHGFSDPVARRGHRTNRRRPRVGFGAALGARLRKWIKREDD